MKKERLFFLEETQIYSHFFVAVAPLSNIGAFYVVVDKQLYKLENALTALDITFKIFFALEYTPSVELYGRHALVYKIQDDTGLSSSASIVLAEVHGKLADKLTCFTYNYFFCYM